MLISDEATARRCLCRIGYYRLSAYWYPFRSIQLGPPAPTENQSSLRLDTFVENTSYKEVLDFYIFDKRVKLLVSDGLERIEICMRALIANLLGEKDPLSYRKPNFLDGNFTNKKRNSGKTLYEEWLEKQDKKFKSAKDDFAEHFKKKYPGSNPPIWIACEVWDWGTLSIFFSGMTKTDKDYIAKKFGNINGKQMESWLRCLNIVRNICAHHSRLWNRDFAIKPSLPEKGILPQLDHLPRNGNQAIGRLYTVLSIMAVMVNSIHISNSTWNKRVKELALISPENPLISSSTAGFPIGWENQSIWH